MSRLERFSSGLDHVRILCDEIGPRGSGSEGDRRAAEYIASRLVGYGLSAVAQEPFEALGWAYSKASFRALKPNLGRCDCLPVEFSASTPEGGLEAELTFLGSMEELGSQRVEGRVVMLYGGLGDHQAYGRLMSSGAAAIVLIDMKPWPLCNIVSPSYLKLGSLPSVSLSCPDAIRLLSAEVSRVRLDVQTSVSTVASQNVVGVVPGVERPEEEVLVAAHYDSVPVGPGAEDNAAGVAVLLEAARVMAGSKPRRTVRFIAFSAEETGLGGAFSYVRRHRAGLAHAQFMVYLDGLGGALGRNNALICGGKDLEAYVKRLSDELQYHASVRAQATGLDDLPFCLEGIPSAWLQREPQYTWHSRFDTSEAVSSKALAQASEYAYELALRVANSTEPPFRREIPEELLRGLRRNLAAYEGRFDELGSQP